jgi:hypothetical protein
VRHILPQRSAGFSLRQAKRIDELLGLSLAPPAKADRHVQASTRPPRKFRITLPPFPSGSLDRRADAPATAVASTEARNRPCPYSEPHYSGYHHPFKARIRRLPRNSLAIESWRPPGAQSRGFLFRTERLAKLAGSSGGSSEVAQFTGLPTGWSPPDSTGSVKEPLPRSNVVVGGQLSRDSSKYQDSCDPDACDLKILTPILRR